MSSKIIAVIENELCPKKCPELALDCHGLDIVCNLFQTKLKFTLKPQKIFRCAECLNNHPVGTTLRKRPRSI